MCMCVINAQWPIILLLLHYHHHSQFILHGHRHTQRERESVTDRTHWVQSIAHSALQVKPTESYVRPESVVRPSFKFLHSSSLYCGGSGSNSNSTLLCTLFLPLSPSRISHRDICNRLQTESTDRGAAFNNITATEWVRFTTSIYEFARRLHSTLLHTTAAAAAAAQQRQPYSVRI